MKFTVMELVFMKKALANFLSTKIPASTAFKTISLAKAADDTLRSLEERRGSLIKSFGAINEEKSEEGNEVWSIPGDKQKEFDELLNAILEETVDVDFEPIPISELGAATIATADMVVMEKMFTE